MLPSYAFLQTPSFCEKHTRKSSKTLETIKYGELFMAIYNLILHISYLQPNYRQWNSFKMAEKEWHFTIDR